MSKLYDEYKTTVREVAGFKCDVCGRIDYDSGDGSFETQEYLQIDFMGGFGSVFGDCIRVRGDICQHCLKKLLGKYLKLTD
jgi:hypothetical protein